MTDQTNAPAGAQLSPAAIIQEMGANIETLTQRGYLLATTVEAYRKALDRSKARVSELEAELQAMRDAATTQGEHD